MRVIERLRRGGLSSVGLGGDTSVRIASINPFTSRLPGGATVTLSGFNFRNNSGGTAPSVTVGGVPATGVALVDGNTLTFIVPVGTEVGYFDVVLTIDGNSATLANGFVYYSEEIAAVKPVFGPISGGTAVTIDGYNFVRNQVYTVWFGDQEATDVVVVDERTITAVTPAHSVGFSDVYLKGPAVMFDPAIFDPAIFDETGQVVETFATFRNGFQYTLLLRGEDVRRNPGISISESLGAPPSTMTLRIDGNSVAPHGGEKIEVVDKFDNNRLLWGGTVQSIDQVYEGQITQLAWNVKCVDYTWLANRKRPFGAWRQTSVSQVVKELISTFCPGFTSTFVQTNLAKVTYSCDGSKDLIQVLSELASLIGGGHWYFDFQQDLHFFHIVPPVLRGGPPKIPPLGPGDNGGSLTQYCTLAAGVATTVGGLYTLGFYALRVQFVYSDKSVSALRPWSNVCKLDGAQSWAITNIPIGAAVGGKTVIARRLWYHAMNNEPGIVFSQVRAFCQIDDNTTTALTTDFKTSNPSIAVSEIPTSNTTFDQLVAALQASHTAGTLVAVWGGQFGEKDCIRLQAAASVPTDYQGLAGYIGGSDIDDYVGNIPVPNGANANTPPGPLSPPTAEVSSEWQANPLIWYADYMNFRYAYLYRDGSVSFVSPASNITGHQNMIRGYATVTNKVTVKAGAAVDGADVIARLIFADQGDLANPGASESRPDPPGFPIGSIGALLKTPDWSNASARYVNVIPDNVTEFIHYHAAPLGLALFNGALGDPNSANYPYWRVLPGPGDTLPLPPTGQGVNGAGTLHLNPATDGNFTFTPDPVPIWPNEDGPFLEIFDPPEVIDDANTTLLHGESGSAPFQSTSDLSQVRNRIFVFGSGSTLVDNYDGSKRLYVADITNFALGGGKLRIYDPASGKSELADYLTLEQDKGIPFISLKAPLNFSYAQGSGLYNYYQADDVESQKFFAKFELDAFGRPTDGIHEFTISDGSLKTVWQLFMRAEAELEIYSRPIVNITYATRDPNSRIGRQVEVDLTNPPCQGTFLIQSVSIDQIRNEGDDLLPRYNVRACSVRYSLDDLLLRILDPRTMSVSVAGIASAAANQAGTGTDPDAGSSFPGVASPVCWLQITGAGTSSPIATGGVGCAGSFGGSGSQNYDTDEIFPSYADDATTNVTRPRTRWGTLLTTATLNNNSYWKMNSCVVQFLEDGMDCWFELQTGKALAGVRYWAGVCSSGVIPAGVFGTNIGVCALRYQQGLDSGWSIVMQSELAAGGITFVKSMNVAVSPSTRYIIRMVSQWDYSNYQSMTVAFTVNGVTVNTNWRETRSSSAPFQAAMPTAGHATSNGPATLLPFMGLMNNDNLSIKKLNVRRMYAKALGD